MGGKGGNRDWVGRVSDILRHSVAGETFLIMYRVQRKAWNVYLYLFPSSSRVVPRMHLLLEGDMGSKAE